MGTELGDDGVGMQSGWGGDGIEWGEGRVGLGGERGGRGCGRAMEERGGAPSLATFAPMRTETSIPFISSLMRFEMRIGPDSENSMPLMSETARQFFAMPVILGQMRPRNWWGRTKTSIVAPSQQCVRSGSATTFSVNLMPWPQ